jgi:hypothetical protein
VHRLSSEGIWGGSFPPGTCAERHRGSACRRGSNTWSPGARNADGLLSVKPSAQPTLVRTQHLPPAKPQVTLGFRFVDGLQWERSGLPRGRRPAGSDQGPRSWPGGFYLQKRLAAASTLIRQPRPAGIPRGCQRDCHGTARTPVIIARLGRRSPALRRTCRARQAAHPAGRGLSGLLTCRIEGVTVGTRLDHFRTATLRLMDVSKIEPGTVFRFPHDDRPNRVLLHDSDVVMYDAWWPHLDGWGLADLEAIKHQRISYYVTTVSTVLEKATYLRSDPLSADERAVHRPDLPFAAVHDAMITWSSAYTGRLTEARSELNTSQIYLLPFGPGGGTKAGFGSSRTTAPPSRPRSCSARHRSPRPGTSAM